MNSLATAYAMKKKMARGGSVDCDDKGAMPMAEGGLVDRIMAQRCYSKGGMVANETPIVAPLEEDEFDDLVLRDDLDGHYVHPNDGPDDEQENKDRDDIVSRIMRSRKLKDRNPSPA